MVDGVARLCMVFEEAEKTISMTRVKNIGEEIVINMVDEDSKDCITSRKFRPATLGETDRKGTKIVYFVAQFEGRIAEGVVIEDPAFGF